MGGRPKPGRILIVNRSSQRVKIPGTHQEVIKGLTAHPRREPHPDFAEQEQAEFLRARRQNSTARQKNKKGEKTRDYANGGIRRGASVDIGEEGRLTFMERGIYHQKVRHRSSAGSFWPGGRWEKNAKP